MAWSGTSANILLAIMHTVSYQYYIELVIRERNLQGLSRLPHKTFGSSR